MTSKPKKEIASEYLDVKKKYKDYFELIDTFLKDHPEATLEYNGIMETKPYLGFVYYAGSIKVCVDFEMLGSEE